MAKNDLVVRQVGNDIHILGIIDADDDHRKFAGVDPRHQKTNLLIKRANATEAEISSAVSMSTIWGAVVDAKHVKFAQPIILKDAAQGHSPIQLQAKMKRDASDDKGKDNIILADPRIEQIFAPQSDPDKCKDEADTNTSRNTENMPSKRSTAVDAGSLVKLAKLIMAVEQGASEEELVKEAKGWSSTGFGYTDLIDALQDSKIDGREIGFNIPCKVEFKDEATKKAFLALARKAKPMDEDTLVRHSTKALDKVAAALAPLAATSVERLLQGLNR